MAKRGRPPRVSAECIDGKRVIRRYHNRRLYDTAAGEYVNLEWVLRLYDTAEDFAVFEADTGRDITDWALRAAIIEVGLIYVETDDLVALYNDHRWTP